MKNLFDAIKNGLMGADDYDDYDEDYIEEEAVSAVTPAPVKQPRPVSIDKPERVRGTTNSDWKVYNNDGTNRSVDSNSYQRRTKILKATPTSIDASRTIIDNIKKDIITFVDLTNLEPGQAQRIADFLAGAIYALEGSIARVNDESFMVAPPSVDLFEYEQELKQKSKVAYGAFGFNGL